MALKGYEIVREETARLARGMAPLALIAFGILLLAGFEPLRTGVSLLAGTAYSILLFAMIGRSAARAVLFPPAQGTRIVRRGYFFRYLLTGAAVFAAIRLPQLQPLAAILPLFFPKLILLWQQVHPSVRKGGEENGPEILGYLFGNTSLPITETMRNSWIIMAFILFLCIFLTRRMEKIPKGKQAFAEKAVLMIDGLVDSTMGEGCRAFSPYIMTLMMSSLFGSLASLFWMRSTTADLNTTLGWAIITFILITYNKIKFGGIKGYLKGFLEPIFVMAPLNVLSEIATPVSMSFRHFGNMAGGLVITTLIMGALKVLSNAVLGFLPVPLLQIGLPGVLSLYFDCFTACMQAFIFSMLTMAYVGDARGS